MKKLFRAALSCAASIGGVTTAHAQSAGVHQAPVLNPRAADQSVEDIIVTAQKRSERLFDVPLSITSVSGEQLTRRGISSPADLARVVPGFTYQQSVFGAPVYQIRGIGFFDNQVAVPPTVTIYTDQAPIPYSRMAAGASLDVERVEVLKGPQGTLFGQNSTGGAVNYIAAKPTQKLSAGFDASYARFNEVDLGGFVSSPVTDTLGVRIAARYERRDGWQRSITRNDISGRRNFLVGRIIADWQLSDRLKVELNVNAWRDRSEIQLAQPRGYLPINPAPPTTPETIAGAAGLRAYPYPIGDTSNRLADWNAGFSRQVHDQFFQAAARIEYDVSESVRLITVSAYSHLTTYTKSLEG